MALFDVYDIEAQMYLPRAGVQEVAAELGLPVVETAAMGDVFLFSPEGLRTLAEGVYPTGKQREGVVIRPWNGDYLDNTRVSFKVINLRYKD